MKYSNKKGFALVEILAVTVVVMIIFAFLYANFLPLKGEYNKRIAYTDVESEYINFYMRKFYKDKTINLGSKGYEVLYDGREGGSKTCKLLSGTEKAQCEDLASKAGVETLVVTTKNIEKIKAVKDDESLDAISDYLYYLPDFNEGGDEPYRLIIKTSTGYGTTELKVFCNVTSASAVGGAKLIIEKQGSDGIVQETHSTTQQLCGSKSYRYTGINPNNYVSFNNELWRIIGVFDVDDGTGKYKKRIKLIRDKLGVMSWDTAASNNWSTASAKNLLNSGDYWNRTGSYASNGLMDDAKNMIDNAKWYTGSTDDFRSSSTGLVKDFYNFERSTSVPSGNATSWIGKVGVMYPSDYAYATGGGSVMSRNACLNKQLITWNTASDCYTNNWLYDSVDYQWTITPFIGSSRYIFDVSFNGEVCEFCHENGSGGAMRPSVYLKSNVKITGGTGTSSDPYQLSV